MNHDILFFYFVESKIKHIYFTQRITSPNCAHVLMNNL